MTMTPSPSIGARTRKDFLSVLDFEPLQLDRCLDLAAQMKADRSLGHDAPMAQALGGRHVAMLFERRRCARSTFEIAIRGSGATWSRCNRTSDLDSEAVADVARTLERWVEAVIIRTFRSAARGIRRSRARLHVVNALTDEQHPCQALAA